MWEKYSGLISIIHFNENKNVCWLHLKNDRGKREMIVVFPYYSFIIYRVFLKYFHINILNWYKNVNSPLEGKEWPEIIVQSEPLKIRNFLTSPVSVFNFISTIHIKICSILFWFHFEDDIINYLSESLFLKKQNLYLVSSRTSQGTPGVHLSQFEKDGTLKKASLLGYHSPYNTCMLCTNQRDHQLLKVT